MSNYVYDGLEVKKTGRIAEKKLTKPIRLYSHNVEDTKEKITSFTLVEITPIDGLNTWKKWVKEEELYKIKED